MPDFEHLRFPRLTESISQTSYYHIPPSLPTFTPQDTTMRLSPSGSSIGIDLDYPAHYYPTLVNQERLTQWFHMLDQIYEEHMNSYGTRMNSYHDTMNFDFLDEPIHPYPSFVPTKPDIMLE